MNIATARAFRLGSMTALIAASLTGCDPDAEIVRPDPPIAGALFRSYVALGNSLTAGFQSGGINAATQADA